LLPALLSFSVAHRCGRVDGFRHLSGRDLRGGVAVAPAVSGVALSAGGGTEEDADGLSLLPSISAVAAVVVVAVVSRFFCAPGFFVPPDGGLILDGIIRTLG